MILSKPREDKIPIYTCICLIVASIPNFLQVQLRGKRKRGLPVIGKETGNKEVFLSLSVDCSLDITTHTAKQSTAQHSTHNTQLGNKNLYTDFLLLIFVRL